MLLQYLNKRRRRRPSRTRCTPRCRTRCRATLTVLDKSAAEDKDAVVVTRETATRLNLKTLDDLAPQCGQLVFGGPPEFQTRPDGIPGIQKTYGCTFKEYRSLDAGGPLTVAALKNGDVQAADIFTTDASIPANDFVVLEDPKNNFAAQNVVPLINKAKANDTVRQALNAVSAKLTTENLTALNAEAAATRSRARDGGEELADAERPGLTSVLGDRRSCACTVGDRCLRVFTVVRRALSTHCRGSRNRPAARIRPDSACRST